jgi:hypothetical protein
MALDRMLLPPPQRMTPDGMQNYLKLLAEAYKKTHSLAARLQNIVGGEVNCAVSAVPGAGAATCPI